MPRLRSVRSPVVSNCWAGRTQALADRGCRRRARPQRRGDEWAGRRAGDRVGTSLRRGAVVGGRGLPACHPRDRTGTACSGRAAGAGAAEADSAAAPQRPYTWQIGRDRRARDRSCRTAGAEPRSAAAGRAGAARTGAAGRPPRRPGGRASAGSTAIALAPARARPDPGSAAGHARPGYLARAACTAARPP